MLERMFRNWPQATLPMAMLLFFMTPLLSVGWPQWQTAFWLLLPVYLVHQYEEHDGDRFRTYINNSMFGGRNGLTLFDSFVINVGVVWFGIAMAIYLAVFIRPGMGLFAVYLVLFNSLVHLANALSRREYNPGLWTALTLFPVFGIHAWLAVHAAGAGLADHVAGLGIAIAGHLAIVLNARRRIAAI